MRLDKRRVNVAFLFTGAALAWPALLCAITDAMATPLQRALSASWCGAGPHAAEILGHCAACWSGSAAFLAAAALSLALQRRLNPRAAI